MKYAIGALCLVLLLVSFAGCVTPPPGLPGLPGGPGNITAVPTGDSTTVATGEPTTSASVTTATTTVTTPGTTGASTTPPATTVTTSAPTGELTTGSPTTATTTAPTGVSTSAPGTPDTPEVTATGTAVVTTTVPVPSTTPGAEPPSTTLPLVLIGIVGLVAIIGVGWMMRRRTAPADDQDIGAAVGPDNSLFLADPDHLRPSRGQHRAGRRDRRPGAPRRSPRAGLHQRSGPLVGPEAGRGGPLYAGSNQTGPGGAPSSPGRG